MLNNMKSFVIRCSRSHTMALLHPLVGGAYAKTCVGKYQI